MAVLIIILQVVEWILFVLLTFNVLYLLVFSLASLLRYKQVRGVVREQKCMAVLIPSYKEDAVIADTVHACLQQTYPSDKYEVVVISDRMKPETNDYLRTLPIRLVEVNFERSTKAKSLNEAMRVIGDRYDVAVVLDADNLVSPSFLTEINEAFAQEGVEVVQAHRMAKNLNTDMAFLDAMSEEINNSIFRLGHVNLGLSTALIGSGMAFDYALFKHTMALVDSVGEDREMEFRLLSQGRRFYYLQHTLVQDEKIQTAKDFTNQRRRWLAAQFLYGAAHAPHLLKALLSGRWNYLDKVLQHFLLPRVLLLGILSVLTISVLTVSPLYAVKWVVLWTMLAVALLVAIPRKYYTKRLWLAVLGVPKAFVLMFLNLFRLKDAHKHFIHTQHGVKDT